MSVLYLWDQAWTLIDMTWDVDASGFADYDAFARFASNGASDTDPFVYEQFYELTFAERWHQTAPLAGALEVLTLPGEHWVFTTGLPEQWAWILASLPNRANARRFEAAVSQNRSTFEWSYENVKTTPMYRALFAEIVERGFRRVVAIDDKPRYLEQALAAAARVPTLTFEPIHVATYPEPLPTPAGIRRLASLESFVENERHD